MSNLREEREKRFAVSDEIAAKNLAVSPREAEEEAAMEIAAARQERRQGTANQGERSCSR